MGAFGLNGGGCNGKHDSHHIIEIVNTCKLVLLFCLVATLASLARAGVTEQLSHSEYVAHAEPNQSIFIALRRDSPINRDGRVYLGITQWQVTWDIKLQERTNGTCRISANDTQLKINIVLPRLIAAGPDQDKDFGRFLSALDAHEQGHVDIARRSATEIDRAILGLPDMENCKVLEDAANDAGRRGLEYHREKDRLYDKWTEHGKSQGTWLE